MRVKAACMICGSTCFSETKERHGCADQRKEEKERNRSRHLTTAEARQRRRSHLERSINSSAERVVQISDRSKVMRLMRLRSVSQMALPYDQR